MADIMPAGAPAAAPITPTATPTTPNASTPNTAADAVNASDADGDIEVVDTAAADAAKAPKKDAKPSSKKKFQLKVDGRDEEIELDMGNEEEVRKHLQLSKAAYKRMQESAEMKKGVQELIETLRTDPLKVLADPRLKIPEDVRQKMAQAIINQEVAEMAKTPEQRETERLQREYERLKQEVETEKQGREKAEFARMQEQEAVRFDSEITTAIESSGLPKTARTVKYMAEALLFCVQNGLDLSAKDLVPYVKKQTLSEFKEMISSLPDEDFENWVGKERLGSIRKRNLAKAKAVSNPASGIKATGADAKKTEEAKKRIPIKDFLGGLGKF